MKFPWLKKIQDFFTFLLEEDIRNDFKDDGKPYFVLEKQRKFLKNSCKGDYRLYRLQEGFCACWKDRIVARNEDGLQRFIISIYFMKMANYLLLIIMQYKKEDSLEGFALMKRTNILLSYWM